MIRVITSHSNPLIKRVKSLQDKKHRAREGLFLAEGMRIVIEAVDAGHVPQMLLFGPGTGRQPALRRAIAACSAAGGELIETSTDILEKLTGKSNPQALVGVFARLPMVLESIDPATADIWIVLQSIKDPGNLGTILRTGDAIGAGGVILLDQCCDPFSVEAVRSSMGALFTQQLAQADRTDFFGWVADRKARCPALRVIGASLNTSSDYQAYDYPRPTLLLMGNEQSGLPPAYEAACDALVKLPMRGKADSLNVAMATAVLGYEVLNQHRRMSD